ncbi:MAG TPA: hypothetical protein PKH24_21340 [Sedimentisphaerales bacterium]|nr:hypothetical protein [Sedimentisphaerales bacterium]HNU31787.1 hypothetical protein [Sedimentisphaerales bacterium]
MRQTMWIALMGMVAAGVAGAADVNVTSNIVTSTTWTANNVYHLKALIYVEPGASLTIEPGTIIRGTTESALIIAKGAQIFANGRKHAPIIMTSEQDDLVTWRASCEEWGNLTIMGNALIAATLDGQGTGQPDGTDTAQMEGLTARFAGDTLPLYGGNDDDDDSGVIRYVSLRYGGKVLSIANELNGMSIGGVGRATEIDYVEIMNNVDDGIEIWGGTVCLKHVSIWNIGDDSFDLDQGYRGKAQFGLIVQGYCGTKSQGSGIGDNCFEMDGAESAAAQPFGAASIYNFTVIGQPYDGDVGTEWRDNMRAQFGNCVFMDLGDKVILDGGTAGDGGGYGSTGVPTLAGLFASLFSNYPTNTVGSDPKVLYPNFTSGAWCQFTDCVFYNNKESATLTTFGQMAPALGNKVVTASPIQAITRDAPVQVGGKVMARVISLNPLAANDAVTADGTAPDDGFFTPVAYKGAFGAHNWLKGWSAADAYGMLD